MPIAEYGDDYRARLAAGRLMLADLRVDVVGLARNCAMPLLRNLDLAITLGKAAKDWRVFVAENDSIDATKSILYDVGKQFPYNVFCHTADYGRTLKSHEWAGNRTIELAQYRTVCQEWVAGGQSDITLVFDWDAWGGWVEDGLLVGLYDLMTDDTAYGSSSVSLLETSQQTYDIKTGALTAGTHWVHYDCWALRLNCYWDDYGRGLGNWKHYWLPPVGTPKVKVASAFGGLTIYKTKDYLAGTYDGSDCEHVPFHRSIQEKTGRDLYLNPSQRTVMKWEPTDGQHDQRTDQPV
jgi:hypothetical protein